MTGARQSFGSIVPHAVREFANGDLEWMIHRQMYLKGIDVLQLEYMPLGQYAGDFRQIPSILFEHDCTSSRSDDNWDYADQLARAGVFRVSESAPI